MLCDKESIDEIQSVIHTLPNLENDNWPFLPKDIFTLSKPITNLNLEQIAYEELKEY